MTKIQKSCSMPGCRDSRRKAIGSPGGNTEIHRIESMIEIGILTALPALSGLCSRIREVFSESSLLEDGFSPWLMFLNLPVHGLIILAFFIVGGITAWILVAATWRRERVLRETRLELEAIFENAPEMMILMDGERRVRKVNHAAADFTGHPAEDLTGLRTGEAIRCLHALENPKGCGFGSHCETCAIRRTVQDTYGTGKVYYGVEAALSVSDGEKKKESYLLLSSIPIAVSGSRMVLVCFQDISKQKKTEVELRTIGTRLRKVVENMPVMMDAFDADGNIVVWNRECERVTGYGAEEIVGNAKAMAMLYPDDAYRERMMKEWKERGNDYRNWEWEVTCKDGSKRIISWSNISGRMPIPGWETWGVGMDVTQRKQVERALSESEEKYRKLVESANVAILAADAETGLLLEVNRRAEELLGYSAEELIGMPQSILHPRDQEEKYRMIFQRDVQAKRFDTEKDDLFAQHKSGRLIPIRITSSVTKVGERRIIQGIFHDLSGQKRAEEQVRRYSEELENELRRRTKRIRELERQRMAVEKLAAAGRMAARIAHEINNPLAGIKNAFALVKNAIPRNHPYFEYGDLIENEIDRIARIVHQMFDLYRPEQEFPRVFKVSETIVDVVALLEPSCRKEKVKILVDPGESPPVVHLPEGHLRQVLFNILQNAIEASPSGGQVKCSVSLEAEDRLCISVEDKGKGIPESVGAQIYEPFFTTKTGPSKRGLGLGLSTSRSLVIAMGGSLEFQSQPGRGTLFRIILPLYIEKVKPQEK